MPKPTYYAQRIINELGKRGIKAIPEYSDGHKCVDIYIPEAKLDIEVDGSHHTRDVEQALRDLLRTKFSLEQGRRTIRIPNSLVYNHPEKVADIIREIVDKDKKKITKQTTLEQVISKENKAEIKKVWKPILVSSNRKPHFSKEKTKVSKKVLVYAIIIIIILGIFAFIVFNNQKKDSTNNNIHTQDNFPAPIPQPQIKPLIVEGSATNVIITNNQDKAISVNVTYRIYSNWFGIDTQSNQIFDVDAKSKQMFKVYNNDGCSTAPCSVSIVSYSELV